MSYADIEKTKADREAKEAKEVEGKPSRKCKTSAPEALQITKKTEERIGSGGEGNCCAGVWGLLFCSPILIWA